MLAQEQHCNISLQKSRSPKTGATWKTASDTSHKLCSGVSGLCGRKVTPVVSGVGHRWAARPYLGMFRITHLINELRSCFQCCLLLFRVGTLAFNKKREKRGQLFKSSAYPEKKLSQVLVPFATVEGPSLPAGWCQIANDNCSISFMPFCDGWESTIAFLLMILISFFLPGSQDPPLNSLH